MLLSFLMLFIAVALFLSLLTVPDCFEESTFPVPTYSFVLSLKNPYYQFQLFFLFSFFEKSCFPVLTSFILIALTNLSFQFQFLLLFFLWIIPLSSFNCFRQTDTRWWLLPLVSIKMTKVVKMIMLTMIWDAKVDEHQCRVGNFHFSFQRKCYSHGQWDLIYFRGGFLIVFPYSAYISVTCAFFLGGTTPCAFC